MVLVENVRFTTTPEGVKPGRSRGEAGEKAGSKAYGGGLAGVKNGQKRQEKANTLHPGPKFAPRADSKNKQGHSGKSAFWPLGLTVASKMAARWG